MAEIPVLVLNNNINNRTPYKNPTRKNNNPSRLTPRRDIVTDALYRQDARLIGLRLLRSGASEPISGLSWW
jgi:hypothetical protein